jgi:hypothetical protein
MAGNRYEIMATVNDAVNFVFILNSIENQLFISLMQHACMLNITFQEINFVFCENMMHT